jgi:uncharacterized membrane protein YkoI
MRLASFLFALTLCLSNQVSADDSYLEARRLAAEGEIQPLSSILDRIQTEQPGSILEVELHREEGRMIYELEILDTKGDVWELKVDAVSGDILKREAED